MSVGNSRPLSVFLCHSSADKSEVRKLYEQLHRDGVAPWLDEENLLPGQDWHIEITKAVKSTDVVVVCLSKGSVTKEGYLQREIRIALDVADEKTEGSIFIIPLKLEDCSIPERLSRWHWVKFYKQDGYSRLIKSLCLRAEAIGVSQPGIFDSAEAYKNRADIYLDRNQLDEALADYNQAIKLKPDYVDAYFQRGYIYVCKGLLDEAMNDCNQVIEYKPDHAKAWCNRGHIHRNKGKLDEATANYDQAIRLDPANAFFHVDRALAHLEKNEFDEALADFNRAINLKSDLVRAYFGRGKVYLDIQEYDNAMADYNQVLKLSPDDACAYFNRGIIYDRTGFKKTAVADFRSALDLMTDTTARITAFEMLRDLGVKLE